MTCADCSSDLLLALNGADERLQLALGNVLPGGGCELLASQEWTVPGEAVRFLVPGLRQMLDGLGLNASAVRRIACVTGPGSFTGLRMSLAVAQGLAAATGAQLAGLEHLALLAREAAQISEGTVLPLVWSRRGQVYAQAFVKGEALTQPQVLQLTRLPEFIKELPRPLHLLGGGLRKNLAFFEELAAADPSIGALRLLPPSWDAPRPAALLELAARAEYSAEPLSPVYLRASDAEDNLTAIAAGRGISAEEARAVLARGSRAITTE